MRGYQLSTDWPDLPPGFIFGNPTGLGIDSNQDIWIFHRAGRQWLSDSLIPATTISSKTILKIGGNSGRILDSWGDDLFIMPHGLTIDHENNIWVTDVGLQQVFKFSREGKLLMTIGVAGVAGNDQAHFNLPTDIAVTKTGSFYVTDGYGNNRVVMFSAGGEYLFEWGNKGDKAGEFNLPHAIDLDNDENVYIADRENCRVQVFTPGGQFIKQYAGGGFGKISSVITNPVNNELIAVDYTETPRGAIHGSGFLFFDTTNNSIIRSDEAEGLQCWYHNVASDQMENLYVTDILRNTVCKLMKLS